jgi:hypothetical protein
VQTPVHTSRGKTADLQGCSNPVCALIDLTALAVAAASLWAALRLLRRF